ncbi:hypothetical protein B0H14DRAFT_2586409 [Mycena olivaceomarginata]|nr:hypothetical protein B0H14DRAFT_2586409 [Mycena olivaceomarginata]
MLAESYIHANHARHDRARALRLGPRLPTLRIASAAILIGTSHLPVSVESYSNACTRLTLPSAPSNAPRPRPYRPTLERKHPGLGLEAGRFASLDCAWRQQRHPHCVIFISQSDAGAPHRSMHSLARLFAAQAAFTRPCSSCFLRRRTGRTTDNRSTSAIVSLWAQSASGVNFLLKPAPPPMATISRYTTAPSLAQSNEIMDTHINILRFSPTSFALDVPADTTSADIHIAITYHDSKRTSRHSCKPPEPILPSALHSTPGPPHLILDAHTPNRFIQLQNTLRAPTPLPPLPVDAEADGPVGTTCRPSWARAPTPTRGEAPSEKLAYPAQQRHEGARARARRPRPHGSRAGTAVLSSRSRTTAKAHFWVGVSIARVVCIGSVRSWRRERVLGDLVQVVYVDVAEAERIKRLGVRVERVGPGELEGDGGGGDGVQKKIQELRGKDGG